MAHDTALEAIDLRMQASLHCEQAHFRAQAIADLAAQAKRVRDAHYKRAEVLMLLSAIDAAAARHPVTQAQGDGHAI